MALERLKVGTVGTDGTVILGEVFLDPVTLTDNLDLGERTVGEVSRRSGSMTDNLDPGGAWQSGLKPPPTGSRQ